MGESEDKARPPETLAKEELVFHYSRSRRLEDASERVRRLNDGQSVRRGLFKSLTATRSLAMLFFAVLFIAAANLLVGLVATPSRSAELDGQVFSASAFRYEGTLYVTLARARKRHDAFEGDAAVAISSGGTVLAERAFAVGSEPEGAYRWSFPSGDGKAVRVSVTRGGRKIEISAPIK